MIITGLRKLSELQMREKTPARRSCLQRRGDAEAPPPHGSTDQLALWGGRGKATASNLGTARLFKREPPRVILFFREDRK